ncbi:hypothetical protein KAW44_02165 [Candidatus Bipolaricaulota bacterium]|nr:hypothetical protein [Candidatus Bipolaricaulota bacterium]
MTSAADFHDSTLWKIGPSFKYDVLTFLNVLTGDPFYTSYYPREHERFESRLTPDVLQVIAGIKRKIKDRGGIVSAFLTLYFSASTAETLDGMLAVVHDSEGMRETLRRTEYYGEEGWTLYESVRPELETVFDFLLAIRFSDDWHNRVLPGIEKKIQKVEVRLPGFNVIKAVESHLGRPLSSGEITVYMLHYSQPHGIRITGNRFLTDAAWPFSIVIRNAVHEMMHPPYDLRTDRELSVAIERLRGDSFLMDRVEHHDPSFGYNSFEGFVEEDVVQASDQIINERLGIANDPLTRWKESNGGMHVLAVALYRVMKKERFGETGESLRAFLIRQIEAGDLKPGQVESLCDSFHGESVAK